VSKTNKNLKRNIYLIVALEKSHMRDIIAIRSHQKK